VLYTLYGNSYVCVKIAAETSDCDTLYIVQYYLLPLICANYVQTIWVTKVTLQSLHLASAIHAFTRVAVVDLDFRSLLRK